MTQNLAQFAYLISGVLFILALRGLSSPKTARQGNLFGIVGMVIAIGTALTHDLVSSYDVIIPGVLIGGLIGWLVARRLKMTALPQLVAAFHSLVGLAAVMVAAAAFEEPDRFGILQTTADGQHIGIASLVEMGLGAAIGAVTFSGSIIAFGKLQAILGSRPLVFPLQHAFNALLGTLIVVGIGVFSLILTETWLFWTIVGLATLLGFLLILPIGGADMPVVVSMLNSYSGWAACGVGFTLQNPALIITGALVGSSGAILSYIMCKGMNRSIFNVILGGFGGETAAGSAQAEERAYRSGAAEDAAFLMKNAETVIVVPGYGMAVAQAQHALKDMTALLRREGVQVRFAIHPVAGRMPGHMNVLLAEAGVDYEDVMEMEDINRDFASTEVAFVIGANDVTNPSAKTDKSSPIFGMPILEVEAADQILFVKRSMASGYAGVQNELFFRENTMMLFGDAKVMCESIIKALES